MPDSEASSKEMPELGSCLLEMVAQEYQQHRLASAAGASTIVISLSQAMVDHLSPLYNRTPYHDSAFSGDDWIQELLNGHPDCIQNELGVCKDTFRVLVNTLYDIGLWSSHHVHIKEQVAIFLYTAVTGLSSTHVAKHFQRTKGTISK